MTKEMRKLLLTTKYNLEEVMKKLEEIEKEIHILLLKMIILMILKQKNTEN